MIMKIITILTSAGEDDHGHQPARHPRPSSAQAGPSRQEDRDSAAQRAGKVGYPQDPLRTRRQKRRPWWVTIFLLKLKIKLAVGGLSSLKKSLTTLMVYS